MRRSPLVRKLKGGLLTCKSKVEVRVGSNMKVRIIKEVSVRGVVDTGAEITVIGEKLFTLVAAVNHLKKSRLKPPDMVPKAYMPIRHLLLMGIWNWILLTKG